jgi:hypothetical protein
MLGVIGLGGVKIVVAGTRAQASGIKTSIQVEGLQYAMLGEISMPITNETKFVLLIVKASRRL